MSAERKFSPEEYELLSAYIDNMLNDAERTALEARLADDEALQIELEALRGTVTLIGNLPILKAPRNFIITPQMLKSRTESGAPQMLKSRTEPGRIIRFPAPVLMSAAASFVAILLGVVLIINSVAPQATPNTTQSIAGIFTDVPDDNMALDVMSASVLEEAPAEDSESPISQRAMPSPTLLIEPMLGAMAMPTHQIDLADEPAPVEIMQEVAPVMIMPQAMPNEQMTQSAFAPPPMMPAPTQDIAFSLTMTPARDDMADTMGMTTITESEAPTTEGVIDILGNAVPPVDAPEQAPMVDESVPMQPSTEDRGRIEATSTQPSVDISLLVGGALVLIGVISLIILFSRMRKA